ncbi:hypothetical protein [Methylobacterium organophilum]|uniref:Uncharacterized protein n=1 Tax=Methylobacterium organophilum TaxID=410 RepID=A0ABQ4T6K9_METOR|nr:hypothetical protein [Methylobacterium organophilum]GJE26179.1 hypothetical protein LKMONMHP_1026 [Methylobacterium organophilum]
MKALLFSVVATMVLGGVAQARPAARVNTNAEAVLAPLREAATTCFAETVMSNPKATRLAQEGRWVEAAGVIGFVCRPEVANMMRTHDRLYGRGTGERYFEGPYARHLDKALAERLEPMLTRKSVASAEPPADKTLVSDHPTEAEATAGGDAVH